MTKTKFCKFRTQPQSPKHFVKDLTSCSGGRANRGRCVLEVVNVLMPARGVRLLERKKTALNAMHQKRGVNLVFGSKTKLNFVNT